MKKRIGFASYPDFSGNSKALFQDMNKKKCNYELIWFCKDANISKKLNNMGINAICDKDDNFIEEFDKTQIIINTHDYFMDIKKDNQIFINLWHGLGPKKAGTLADRETEWIYKFSKKNDYLVANGEFGRMIFATIFNKPIQYVKQFSQPRYKWLFENNGKENIQKLINIDLKQYNKILMYAPTFKKGIGREDSIINENNLLNLNEYDEKILIDYLEKNNILLLLKLHPVEESKWKDIESNNIIKLSDDLMLDNFITINEILEGVDLLISDYSSIYIDYINLERPIIFLNTDKNEFEKNRGILFDSPEFWMEAGPQVHDINSFMYQVDKLLNDQNYYKVERKNFNKLMNGEIDTTNEKLINFILGVDKEQIDKVNDCSLLEKNIMILKEKIIQLEQEKENLIKESIENNNLIQNNKKNINILNCELDYLKQEYDKVSKELESIKYSRSYKMVTKIKKYLKNN